MGSLQIALIILCGITLVAFVSSGFLIWPLRVQRFLIPMLISLAAGCLLATTLLLTVPETARHIGVPRAMQLVLGGILIFFTLEKLKVFRHSHGDELEPERDVLPVVLGNTKSLLDGVIIAIAFTCSAELGTATALAVFVHQIPQEVSDLALLAGGGFSRQKAFCYNYVAALPAAVGGFATALFLERIPIATPYLVAITGSSMIYVSISDLVPALNKYTGAGEGIAQLLFLALGVLAIYLQI